MSSPISIASGGQQLLRLHLLSGVLPLNSYAVRRHRYGGGQSDIRAEVKELVSGDRAREALRSPLVVQSRQLGFAAHPSPPTSVSALRADTAPSAGSFLGRGTKHGCGALTDQQALPAVRSIDTSRRCVSGSPSFAARLSKISEPEKTRTRHEEVPDLSASFLGRFRPPPAGPLATARAARPSVGHAGCVPPNPSLQRTTPW